MVENFTTLYAIVFYVAASAVACCELLPCQRQTVHVGQRWPTNVGLLALNFVLDRVCLPISAVEVAERAVASPFYLSVGAGIGIVLGVFGLDLAKYCEHRLMHQLSPLWRCHLVHHTDTEVDFTTTERHHPIEAGFSSVVLLAVVYMLAVPPLAVVIFLLLGTIVSFVAHANLCLPGRIDRMVRWVVVTPSMHVIHHSALRRETDSNYGVIFTIWDRLFGTYREPRPDRDAQTTLRGLEVFRASRDARLDRVLWHPFVYRPIEGAPPSSAA